MSNIEAIQWRGDMSEVRSFLGIDTWGMPSALSFVEMPHGSLRIVKVGDDIIVELGQWICKDLQVFDESEVVG